MIVDDEHLIADTLALILNRNGFDSTAVYSGETAVLAAAQQRPDILLTDVVMDGMNGIDAAIRISDDLPDCRIILLSGNAATDDLLTEARAEGHAFELIDKPVHPDYLIEHLNISA